MNRIFKLVPWFIGFCFAMGILQISLVSFIGVKAVSEIGENGLQAVVEKVWCGKQQDCKLELNGDK